MKGIEIQQSEDSKMIVVDIEKAFPEGIKKLSKYYTEASSKMIFVKAFKEGFKRTYASSFFNYKVYIYDEGNIEEMEKRIKETGERAIKEYLDIYNKLRSLADDLIKTLPRFPDRIFEKAHLSFNWVVLPIEFMYFDNVYVNRHVYRKEHINFRLSIEYNKNNGKVRIMNSVFKRIYKKDGSIRPIVIERFQKVHRMIYEQRYTNLLVKLAEQYYKTQFDHNIERCLGKILEKHNINYKIKWIDYRASIRVAKAKVSFYQSDKLIIDMYLTYKPQSFRIEGIKYYLDKEQKIPRDLYIRLYRYI